MTLYSGCDIEKSGCLYLGDYNARQNFDELYKDYDKVSMGYDEKDVANPDDMKQYYPDSEQDKYGVINKKNKKIA